MKPGDFLAHRLAVIRERIGSGDSVISFTHTEKLRERRIGARDVEEAIRAGVIIEDYPDDREGRAALFLVCRLGGRFTSSAAGSKSTGS